MQHKTKIKKKKSQIWVPFSTNVSEDGGKGFAEFGGVCSIWTKLKL